MVPRTWYHICIGIDTDSGLLRIVDNGVQAFNGKNDYLENTASMKPKSLAGKLLGNGTFWLRQEAQEVTLSVRPSVCPCVILLNSSLC